MRRTTRTASTLVRPLVLILPALLVACATTSTGGLSQYRRDFGRLLLPTLEHGRSLVWSRHDYRVRQEMVSSTSFYYESEWRSIALTGLLASEVDQARIRITLRGRRVAHEGRTAESVFRVEMEGEMEVYGGEVDNWRPAEVTAEAVGEIAEIAEDLALEVRARVR